MTSFNMNQRIYHMETPTQFKLTETKTLVEIKKFPAILPLFLKVFFLSLIRPSTLDQNTTLPRVTVSLKGLSPEPKKVLAYKKVCGFSSRIEPPLDEIHIPASYLQTLFIGLLGKFITTPHFPINPMGLIQVSQSFEQKRPITTDEILDLSCTLCGATKTAKGIQTQFSLEITSDNESDKESDKEIVWKGISTFFIRDKKGRTKKKNTPKKEEKCLEIEESIFVPRNTGLEYAPVSGDYNPHHLYGFTARLIGFKQPIAHGMWSLARVTASMEKKFNPSYPLTVKGEFKLPIFMPARITLGYELLEQENKTTASDPRQVDFELRDEKRKVPHLKGQFIFNPSKG